METADVEVLKPERALRLSKQTVISLGGLAIAWEIGARFFFPQYAVPSWLIIFQDLLVIRPVDVGITIGRVALAIASSFAIGISLAFIMYLSRRLEEYLMPVVRLLMAVPVICWILFAVLWFTGLEFRIFFVLVVVCAPVFLIDTLDGMKNIPKELREMLTSFRPSRIHFVTKLLFPGAIPVILTSWKINLSLAIRVVTIAELVGTVSGIGYALNVAQSKFSVSEVFALTVVLVVILFAAQVAVSYVEKRALRWRA